MLRIGDKVRPTKEWYRYKYESTCVYPVSMADAMFNDIPPSDEEIERFRAVDWGVVDEVVDFGYAIKMSVKWISESKNSRFPLHDAWWEEKELEVISRNNVYSE